MISSIRVSETNIWPRVCNSFIRSNEAGHNAISTTFKIAMLLKVVRSSTKSVNADEFLNCVRGFSF